MFWAWDWDRSIDKRLSLQEVSCFGAICSIPDLGLESEEVIISVDAAVDGSRQMLLQSLARPDLGLTVLHLDQSGQITGGDESWMPGETPIIRFLAKWKVKNVRNSKNALYTSECITMCINLISIR